MKLRLRPILWFLTAWLLAGAAAGVRLHLNGGVFGEAVPLSTSVAGSLLNALPWLGAGIVAWVMSGRRPLVGDRLLPDATVQAAVAFAVVVGQHVVLAALQSTVIPGELTPPDPWRRLPMELVRRGPAALGVYAVILAGMLWLRHGAATEAPPRG